VSGHDVLVVGAGPAGAATALRLARKGHDVALLDRRSLPRDKGCGDALTPRAVTEVHDLGLGATLEGAHRTRGLRVSGYGTTVEVPWPDHPRHPSFGYVVRRRVLDQLIVDEARLAGVTLLERAEAVAPLVERGFVRGAVVHHRDSGATDDVRGRFVVVADGATSRFGRAIGTYRDPDLPVAAAIRAYWESPRTDDAWLDSTLDLRDREGRAMPGYGWVFPEGDGTVNVGVGVLSTFRDFRSINTTALLAAFVESAPVSWGLSAETRRGLPAAGRIPLGGSVGPLAGPTFLLVGDAAGLANPFNGSGIDTALETGRLAAEVLHDALTGDASLVLPTYPARISAAYDRTYQLARLFHRLLVHPSVVERLGRTALHSRSLLEWSVRIMAGLLRPDELGPAEAAFALASRIAAITEA
jgi:geranylgeranyl reductase family protein